LPLHRPALHVSIQYRTLHSIRQFDKFYFKTAGGTATAREPDSQKT
jgi:hypothetical protein